MTKRKLNLDNVTVDDKALATARKILAKAVHSDISNNNDDKMSMINVKYDKIKSLREKSTHIQFVLDSSGSMSSYKREVIQAYNELLKRQARHPGQSTFGFKTFHQETLPEPLTNPKYLKSFPTQGGTPLFDTIGNTIRMIENKLPGNNDVVFIIITDGHDTGALDYPPDVLKPLIEEKQLLGWQFLFCGQTFGYGNSLSRSAERIGIPLYNTTDFTDITKMLQQINKLVISYRQGDIKQITFTKE